ncbi:MAG: PAS domain-containing protein [Phenylobacterium sp.]|nr:MAG: PAS domain-containing protein [Phenylobacterium sp.]
MAAPPTSDPMPADLSSPWLEHAPSPMATVEGATHIVRDINPAFCQLIGRTRDEMVGKPICELLPEDHECLALLDHVHHAGEPISHTGQARPGGGFWSYTMWPVMAARRAAGAVIQVTERAPPEERTLAMNEALLRGSLRQHELTAAADAANARLQVEIGQRMQSERDALMLTKEISHRIKNNLQIVVALIANEIKRTPAEFAQGYLATEARIAAIAELYALISQSSHVHTIPLDAYLREIARSMSASLLEPSSGVSIEVRSEAVEIDSDRAVPFGLLVNELGTNAIKHAFPNGTGRIRLSVEQAGDQIELTVADDGVGMAAKDPTRAPGKHGSDYVAIFVRQLGGAMAISRSDGTGTTIRIQFPLLVVRHPRAEGPP